MLSLNYHPPVLPGTRVKEAALPLALLPLLLGGARMAGGALLRRGGAALAKRLATWGAGKGLSGLLRGGAVRAAGTGVRAVGTGVRTAQVPQMAYEQIKSKVKLPKRNPITGKKNPEGWQNKSMMVEAPQAPVMAPTSTGGPGLTTRFADWATGRNVVNPTTGKTPGGLGQAMSVGGKLLNTALYGSLGFDLADRAGLMGKKEEEGEGENTLAMNYPGASNVYPAYGKYASAKRRAAFEYGVDQFCKDAGFDEADCEAMYRLIEKQAFDGPALSNRALDFGNIIGLGPAPVQKTNAVVAPSVINPQAAPSAANPQAAPSGAYVPYVGYVPSQSMPNLGNALVGLGHAGWEGFKNIGSEKGMIPAMQETWGKYTGSAATPYDKKLRSSLYGDPAAKSEREVEKVMSTDYRKKYQRRRRDAAELQGLVTELDADDKSREMLANTGDWGIRFWANQHNTTVAKAREAIRQTAVDYPELSKAFEPVKTPKLEQNVTLTGARRPASTWQVGELPEARPPAANEPVAQLMNTPGAVPLMIPQGVAPPGIPKTSAIISGTSTMDSGSVGAAPQSVASRFGVTSKPSALPTTWNLGALPKARPPAANELNPSVNKPGAPPISLNTTSNPAQGSGTESVGGSSQGSFMDLQSSNTALNASTPNSFRSSYTKPKPPQMEEVSNTAPAPQRSPVPAQGSGTESVGGSSQGSLMDLQRGYRPDMSELKGLSKGQGAVWKNKPMTNQENEEWGLHRAGRPMTAADRKTFANSQGMKGPVPDFDTWVKSRV